MASIPNPQIDLAFEYVSNTDKHIFLTGKAGTGKTTFLRRVRQEVNKRMAVVAPTGVAAINAEGVTIHSLFQLPFGIFLPDQMNQQLHKRKFTRSKINLIRSLDLLIIDEISMVRADILDAIDAVLRRYLHYNRPFGGLQLLMIGDLHQLPPVVKQEDWDVLRMHYDTPYFFGSLALQKTDAVTIELQHIYRQSDQQFIDLLNEVRSNRMTPKVLELLNSRYQTDFQASDTSGYITLSSHNATARQINAERLQKVSGRIHRFKATIKDNFPPHSFPTEEELELKVNAQVMFVKNDINHEKRYYNGKIGRIVAIGHKVIKIRCPDDTADIEVERSEWKNIKYTLNPDTKEVEEELLGSFEQFPLKLAWAITIHKSQGLTFERVIIDAKAAFVHGQVYVALSRCKSFEGIVLRSKIASSSVRTDRVVQSFTDKAIEDAPTPEQLHQAKKEYQQSLILELFSFKSLLKLFSQLRRILLEHESSFQGNIIGDLDSLENKMRDKVCTVADKFAPQLNAYFAQADLPETHQPLMDRIGKASTYFSEQISKELSRAAQALRIISDNQKIGKRAKEKLKEIQLALFVKKACFEKSKEGFSAHQYKQTLANAEINYQHTKAKTPSSNVVTDAPTEVKHKELYQQLTNWRANRADLDDVPRFAIASTRAIIEMTQLLPTNSKNLKQIKGIGKKRVEKYGAELIEIIARYCQQRDLVTDLLAFSSPSPPQKVKSDTKAISYELFLSGKSVDEIAKERSYVRSTIEGHLCHYIENGELDILKLMPKDRVETILPHFKDSKKMSEVKSILGEEYSYSELRMVWSHLLSLKDEVGSKEEVS